MKKTGLLCSVCVLLIITVFIALGQGNSIRAVQAQEEDTGLVLSTKEYKVKIAVDNKKARVFLDGNPLEQGTVMLAEGIHSLDVSGEGIKSKSISFNVNQDRELNLKTDPPESRLTHQNTLKVGSLPKGMEFTKDGKYLFISLLSESAVVLVDSESEDMQIIKRIEPVDKKYKGAGFVEIGVSPLGDAVLASQMTTASVHRIPLTGETPFEITESVSTGGTWSKVITFNSDGSRFAVSNWSSRDVTVFSYPEMKQLQKINIPGIPRGMVFADDDKTLYVSNYSNGALHKVDLAAGEVISTISVKRLGALRHLVLDEEKNIMYASDMQMECINVYDLTAFKLVRQIKVDYNPNTIAFSPDKKYLYVSCRGPNAKTTYLDRSPRNSYLYMIDCEKQEVIERRELGNQPTALAVHPSGEYVTVSNFRDKNIEIYLVDR